MKKFYRISFVDPSSNKISNQLSGTRNITSVTSAQFTGSAIRTERKIMTMLEKKYIRKRDGEELVPEY